jgi:hypothetical protein
MKNIQSTVSFFKKKRKIIACTTIKVCDEDNSK